MTRAALVFVGVAVLAPLVTWLPMLAYWVPWLPIPHYPPNEGIDLAQIQLMWAALVAALAFLIWDVDRWLAAAVGLGGLQIAVRGMAVDITTVILFALAATAVTWLRRTTREGQSRGAVAALVAAGAFQSLYCLVQKVGYDPLWGVFKADHPIRVLGTLGNETKAGAFIALTGAIAPLWLAPLFLVGIFATASMGALLAFVAAFWWRYRNKPMMALLPIPILAMGMTFRHRELLSGTVAERLTIWGLGLRDWLETAPTWGIGLGRFYDRCPAMQSAHGIDFGKGSLYGMKVPMYCFQAHNEWLQWIYETGLAGAVVLGGWLWTQKRLFLSQPWGAACVALGVVSLTIFPLHMVATGWLAVVLIGFALADMPALKEASS